jgi:hypothetical protein
MEGNTVNINLEQYRIGVTLKDGSSILFRPIRKAKWPAPSPSGISSAESPGVSAS